MRFPPRPVPVILRAFFAWAAVAFAAAFSPAALKPIVEKFDDGKVRLNYTVDEQGRKQGSYKEYREDGKLKVSTSFRDDVMDGQYTRYDEKGTAVEVIGYRLGKFHGWQKRVEGGQVVSEQAFFDGMLLYPRSQSVIRADLTAIARTHVPGTESVEVALAVRRVMAYRYLCEVPHEGIEVDAEMTRQAQAAADICARLGRLSHDPPNPGLTDEQYKLAFFGAKHCNLHMGGGIAGCVDSFMDDSDESNIDRVGHRRWILNPPMLKTAFGGSGAFAAMRTMDTSRKDVPDWDFIAYPTRGFMPAGFFAPHYAWNVSLNPRKYAKPVKSEVKVAVRPIPAKAADLEGFRRGRALELDYFNVNNDGFGVPCCVIFRPAGVNVSSGARYWVCIEGLKSTRGQDVKVEYLVEFCR